MRTFFFSLMLLITATLWAQQRNFAEITGTNVNIRQTASPSGTLLCMEGYLPDCCYIWSNRIGGKRNAFHLEKGDVVEVVAKSNGWTKIRFFQKFGYSGKVNKNNDGFIEGWMSSKFVKPATPVALSWSNIATYANRYLMVPARYGGTNMLWMLNITEGECHLQRGQIEGNHIAVYGNGQLVFASTTPTKGFRIDHGNNTINFGNELAYDNEDWLLDFGKLSPSQAKELQAAIPNTLSHYIYVFQSNYRTNDSESPFRYVKVNKK